MTYALFTAIIALGVFFPRFTKYLIVAPFIGFCGGGFFWAIAAMFNNDLITVPAFFLSAALGMALAEIVAVFLPIGGRGSE